MNISVSEEVMFCLNPFSILFGLVSLPLFKEEGGMKPVERMHLTISTYNRRRSVPGLTFKKNKRDRERAKGCLVWESLAGGGSRKWQRKEEERDTSSSVQFPLQLHWMVFFFFEKVRTKSHSKFPCLSSSCLGFDSCQCQMTSFMLFYSLLSNICCRRSTKGSNWTREEPGTKKNVSFELIEKRAVSWFASHCVKVNLRLLSFNEESL